MSTGLADPVEMIRQGAPRLIHSDAELAVYTDALFDLTIKTNPTPEEEEAIELMTLLVERYEAERYPIPAVSLVLSGKRQLNRDHIARLSRRFNVSPAVFFSASCSR